jgi:hypothetical protein
MLRRALETLCELGGFAIARSMREQMLFKIEAATQKMASIQGPTLAILLFGFTLWNGSSTASPVRAAGSGLSSPVSSLPPDLPTTHWHTTARPWSPLNVPASSYLTRGNNLTSWQAQNTNSSDGCLNTTTYNPFQTSGTSSSAGQNGNLGLSVGIQLSVGNTTNQAKGIGSLNCDTNFYHIATSGGEFALPILSTAIPYYTNFAPATTIQAWKNAINMVQSGMPGNTNNWVTYDMWGFWKAYQLELSTFSTNNFAINSIEGWWTGSNNNGTNQSSRMIDQPWNLYEDLTGVPDSLSVERVGGGNILWLVDAGYSGAHAANMITAAKTAALTDLLMAAADGSNPQGGRQTDHNWVDSAQQLTFDTMAQRIGVSNTFLAGQYQHAAMMTFNSIGNYVIPSGACCNGVMIYPTKAHWDPTLGYGQQYSSVGGGDLGYDQDIQVNAFLSYLERHKSTVTEQPAPVEIGGYAFALPGGSNWSQAFVNAGGTATQIALAGSTSVNNGQVWTAIGINRIGRVGWETRLGPMDGSWNSIGNGANFAPTWISSGTTWTRLAANPSTCSGAFTTTFATPALSLGKVVWTCGSVVFTQNLTVDPDGVLSQTTCSGCPSTWGMTFPILINDGTTGGSWGATTTTTSLTPPIASATWPSSGDSQNYMTISSNATTFISESNQITSFGTMTPVRAYTLDATQVSFVYPAKSGEPTASQVRSGMTITGINTYTNSVLGSSVVSGSGGTYYLGPLAAGGWTNSITISGQTTTFTAPCYFIMTLSGGKVSSIEADRSVTATIPNGINGSYTGANALQLTAWNPRTGL